MDIHQFKKDLRSNQTEAENRIWFFLRAKRFGSLKFKRQQVIGPYIVDFVCYERKVIIELDGGQHQSPETKLYDSQRTAFLESKDFRVLRFWNHEVFLELEGVLEAIFLALQKNVSPRAPLSDFSYAALEKSVSPSRGETKSFINQ
jgi:very-short-patch-repair endonuclease